MFARLSIAQKIYSSFAVLIVLLAATGIAAVIGLNRVATTFDDYREGSGQTLAISALVENLSAARLAGLRFRLDPSPATAELLAGEIASLVGDKAAIMDMFANDAEKQAILDELTRDAGAYADAFARMTALQSQADRLVADIGATGEALRANAGVAVQAASASANFHATGVAAEAVQSLLLTQLDVERFLLSNSAAEFDSAFAHGQAAHAAFTRLESAVFSQSQKQTIAAILADFESYAAMMSEIRTLIDERNAIMDGELDVLGPRMQAGYDAMLASVTDEQSRLGVLANEQAGITSIVVMVAGAFALVLETGWH